MKMFSRSVPGKLGFAIVTLSLVFSSGQVALAADEDHGNPGQFVENIRKGLSGISKYFWSPKSEAPVERKTEEPAAQKKMAVPPKKAQPATDASKKAEPTKTASKPPVLKKADEKAVKSAAKPLTKPVKKTLPVHVTKAPPVKGKKLKADKKLVEGDKKKDALQAALARSAIKKSPEAVKTLTPLKAAPKTVTASPQAKEPVKAVVKAPVPPKEKPVIAAKAEPKAKLKERDLTERDMGTKTKTVKKPEAGTKSAEKAQAVKKQPAKVQPEKKTAAMAPKALDEKSGQKTDQPLKTAKSADAKPVTKKQAKLATTDQDAAKDTPKQPASEIKRGAGLTIASKAKPEGATVAKPRQQLASRKTGTHIWLPDIGSKLSRQFGLTGIPAHGLSAKNDLERTDGRWVFAPYREGVLPSIYGLSDRVHAAEDSGVWVGEGRNWIYVFAKKRTYSSIIGGVQKKAAKASSKKSKASEPKKKKALAVPVKTPKVKDQKQVKAARDPAAKPAVKSADKAETKLAIVKAPAKVKTQTKNNGKASKIAQISKAGQTSKTAKGGNWTKVNGRWVYVPAPKKGQAGPANMSGLARQVEKAPVTGGWVQRNGRWIYVAPQSGQRGKKAHKSKKSKASNAKAGIRIVEKKSAPAKTQEKKKAKIKPSLKPNTKTGLAEGPDEQGGPAHVTGNKTKQQRKNNGSVYLPGKTAQAGGPVSSSGSKLTGKNPQQKPLTKTVGRQFYFFVPGQQPGTGTWYSAPLKMLGKAKKIDNPANFAR